MGGASYIRCQARARQSSAWVLSRQSSSLVLCHVVFLPTVRRPGFGYCCGPSRSGPLCDALTSPRCSFGCRPVACRAVRAAARETEIYTDRLARSVSKLRELHVPTRDLPSPSAIQYGVSSNFLGSMGSSVLSHSFPVSGDIRCR